jgi:hypothetical protein
MATRGRPSNYTETIANEICARLAGGTPLTAICRQTDMPSITTALVWLRDKPDFAALYARARECCIELMAHEIAEIADTPVEAYISRETEKGVFIEKRDAIEHRRLQVDTRKWLLSKMAPHKYGDRPAAVVNIDMRAELEKQLEQIAFGGDPKLIEAWRAGEMKEVKE